MGIVTDEQSFTLRRYTGYSVSLLIWILGSGFNRATSCGRYLPEVAIDLKRATTQMPTRTHTSIPLQQSLNDALVDFYIRLLIVKGPPLGVVVLKS